MCGYSPERWALCCVHSAFSHVTRRGFFSFSSLSLNRVADATLQLRGPPKEARMSRVTILLVGIAALTVISTVAEAAQGCGRGWYYNGRRCVPQDDIGYRPHHRRYVEDDDIGYPPPHHRPGVSVDVAPGIRLHLGHHPRHHYD